MIRFDAATLIVSWAAGGWMFLWVTTRRRLVSPGYGWLARGVFLAVAALSLAVAAVFGGFWPRDVATLVFVGAGGVVTVSSVTRRPRPKQLEQFEQFEPGVEGAARSRAASAAGRGTRREFAPSADLTTAAAGLCAAGLGALDAGGPALLAVARVLTGALFLGALTDAMLLGHWYLVQPGLRRAPLLEMIRAAALAWIPEMASLLWPTGMASVLTGAVSDGYNGFLGWFWLANAAATIVIVMMARLALRERQYSAVMAATGLMYLAILTGFAQDVTARVVLSP